MSAPTPGPWEVGELPEYGCAIVYADDIPIGDFGMDDDADTNSANARLAAAAPELLAALTALRDAIRGLGAASNLNGREFVSLGIQVNDAIAKATGAA